jgi:hypothetical protein
MEVEFDDEITLDAEVMVFFARSRRLVREKSESTVTGRPACAGCGMARNAVGARMKRNAAMAKARFMGKKR